MYGLYNLERSELLSLSHFGPEIATFTVSDSCGDLHFTVTDSCGDLHFTVSDSCGDLHFTVSDSCGDLHFTVSDSCGDLHFTLTHFNSRNNKMKIRYKI